MNIQRWAWRAGYAGYMMRKTRCNYREAMRRADDFMTLHKNWNDWHPEDAAKSKLWIYEK